MSQVIDECKKEPRAEARSAILDQIYRIAYAGDDSLENDAEWPLCLAYGVLVVRSVLPGIDLSKHLGHGYNVGVAVGFDGGDFVLLGDVSPAGLTPFRSRA